MTSKSIQNIPKYDSRDDEDFQIKLDRQQIRNYINKVQFMDEVLENDEVKQDDTGH